MNKTPADIKARNLATSPNLSFIVRAPAGSGKTALLVQRYLRVLSQVDEPEEIVAITFTKKAAVQMRERILTLMQKAKKMSEGKNINAKLSQIDDFEKINLEIALKAISRDKEKNWNLHHSPQRLKIKTIDSYLNDLTRQIPFAHRQENPTDQMFFLAKKAATNVLNFSQDEEINKKILVAYQKIIPFFGYKHDQIIKKLALILTKREQWLGINFDSVLQEKALNKIVSEQLKRLNEQLDGICGGVRDDLRFAFCLSQGVLAKKNFQSQCQKYKNLFISKDFSELVHYQKAIQSIVLTASYEIRKTATSQNGLPASPEIEICNQIGVDKGVIVSARKRLIELLKLFAKDDSLFESFKLVNHLPTQMVDDESFNALMLLLNTINAELEVIYSEQKLVDFSAILLRVIDALGEDGAPSDLSLKLDYQIKHLLIDEFQDVSTLQVRLIEKLIAGWDESSSDRSLFLVGDPMQSIYRFRKANVRSFYEVEKNKRLAQLSVIPLTLSCNFRSSSDLVSTNNQTFSSITENEIFDAVRFEPSIGFHQPKELSFNVLQCIYPNIEKPTKGEKKLVENKIIDNTVSHIKNLLSHQQKEIAILSPTRKSLKPLLEKLKQEKIPFQSSGVDLLVEQIEIVDLINLTLCFLSEHDKKSWFSLLRGVYCGVGLDDLILINNHFMKQNQASFGRFLGDFDLSILSSESALRIKSLLGVINLVESLPLSIYLKVKKTHEAFDLSSYSKNQQKNVDSFFAFLSEKNPLNDEQAKAFLDFIGDKHIHSLSESVIQAMTIHNAKGLEFNHVVCFNLINKRNQNDLDYLLYDQVLGCPIAALNEGKKQGVFAFLNYISKLKEKNERGRLIYVSLTRAKKSNFVALMNKDSLLAQSIIAHYHGLAISLERKKNLEKVNARNRRCETIKERLAINDENFYKELDLDNQQFVPLLKRKKSRDCVIEMLKSKELVFDAPSYQWAGKSARAVGTVAHYFLEQIANKGLECFDNNKIDSLDEKIDVQFRLKNGFDISIKERENIKNILKNTISCEIGRFILTNHKSAVNELKISLYENQQLNNLIIDRSFVDEGGNRWIVDYKTSSHSGTNLKQFLSEEKKRYLAQMNRYALAISRLYPNQPITLALYFPLLKQMKSWKWQNNL